MVVSPIAVSATATEHGRQLVSAVDWTLRLLCKMCVCGSANCASVALQIVQHTHTHTTTVLALRGSYLASVVIPLEIAKAGRQVPKPRCLSPAANSLKIRIAGGCATTSELPLISYLISHSPNKASTAEGFLLGLYRIT